MKLHLRWLLFLGAAFVCLGLVRTSHAKNGNAPSLKIARAFAREARNCLKKHDVACFSKLVPTKMYFPEQGNFGCSTIDTEHHWYINPDEFSACAFTSTKIDDSSSSGKTLFEVLNDCFSEGTEYPKGMGLFKTKSGYSCHIDEDDEGRIFLSGVSRGC